MNPSKDQMPSDPMYTNNIGKVIMFNPEDYPDDAELQRRHQMSLQKYPQLHISQSEFVISQVHRSIIGLIGIWIVTGIVVILALLVPVVYANAKDNVAKMFMLKPENLPPIVWVTIPALIIAALFFLGGYIATYVYVNNKFYLTNESILQFVRFSLFNTANKTVNLRNVRDASYRQDGIFPRLFNYGTLMVTTEGVNEAYELTFVNDPKVQANAIVDAHEHAIGTYISGGDPSNPSPA